jgi:Flp pilus assembly protein protease CpaA
MAFPSSTLAACTRTKVKCLHTKLALALGLVGASDVLLLPSEGAEVSLAAGLVVSELRGGLEVIIFLFVFYQQLEVLATRPSPLQQVILGHCHRSGGLGYTHWHLETRVF